MAAYFPILSKPKSLTAQIREAERQLSIRQHQVTVRGASLLHNIHGWITAPATLLLASGVGFMAGEFTKPQTLKASGSNENSVDIKTTPWKTVMELMDLAQHFYVVLPLALMIKSFFQGFESNQASERRTQPDGITARN